MIFGVSTTKTAVVIAETQGAGERFVINAIRPVPFQVGSGEALAELLQTLTTIFELGLKRPKFTVALLKCSSGRFGSCLESIKAEAITELAAAQQGVSLVKVAPQSLKKALGCVSDQKWRARAAEVFNSDGQHLNWSKGAAGAVAAAFKVAGG